MIRKYLLAAAVIATFAAPAFAATEYYVAQDAKTHACSVTDKKPDGKVETIAVKGTDSYSCEVEDMADAILLGKPSRVSLADSRANTAAILALFESARTGKLIPLQR